MTQLRIKRAWIYQEAFITCGNRLQLLRRDIPAGELRTFGKIHIELDARETRLINIRDLLFSTRFDGAGFLFHHIDFHRGGGVKHEHLDILHAVLCGIENFGPRLGEYWVKIGEQHGRGFVINSSAVWTNSQLRLAVFR